ncbi:MAG: PAS domain-containing protein, partial [Pseudomonadota bacterium]
SVETALGLSEERLQHALDAANDGLFDWDVAERSIYFSPRWEKMLGYEPGTLPGTPQTLRELMHPDDVRETFNNLRAHIRGELSNFEHEYRMQHCTGDWIWILGRAKSVDRVGGSSVRIVGTHTDISERKWIEQSMMAREKQFRTIVSNIPGAVYRRIADDSWTTKFMSDNIETISGYPASDFIDNARHRFSSIIHPEDADETRAALDAALDSGKPFTLEYRIVGADGKTKWLFEKGVANSDPGSSMPFIDGVIFDVTETHSLTEQLSYHESRDVLTGLLNRTEFTRELQQALADATAGQSGFALCYIDLDDFKVVNDTCGQAGGDKLLGELGQALSDRLRDRDTIARLGGDEFAILLRGCSDEHLDKVSKSVCDVAEHFRFEWQGTTLRVSASVGAVALSPEMQSVEDVLRISEAACYVAKESGRNQSHLYRKDDSVVVRRSDEMQWVPRIHLALDQNRFRLFRQSIVPLCDRDRQKQHYEVLLRMIDRRGRMISPGEFLPAAERF